jgi:DNA-binding NarL/FixJ family response regulator
MKARKSLYSTQLLHYQVLVMREPDDLAARSKVERIQGSRALQEVCRTLETEQRSPAVRKASKTRRPPVQKVTGTNPAQVRKASKTRRRTVCLLSSHPLVLAEFERLLSASGYRLNVLRLESTLAPGLERLTLPQAQVYVIDAHSPRQATEVLVAGIQERHPAARQIAVAEDFNEVNAFPLLRLGAKGLLTYKEARQQLPEALEVVIAGGFWVPRNLLSRFVDSILGIVRDRRLARGPADLSRRERETLDALLQNLSNKEIANKLNISERTVKFHVSSLLSKFGVRRRTDLILLCFQSRPIDA